MLQQAAKTTNEEQKLNCLLIPDISVIGERITDVNCFLMKSHNSHDLQIPLRSPTSQTANALAKGACLNNT